MLYYHCDAFGCTGAREEPVLFDVPGPYVSCRRESGLSPQGAVAVHSPERCGVLQLSSPEVAGLEGECPFLVASIHDNRSLSVQRELCAAH